MTPQDNGVSPSPIDVAANRAARKWSRRELLGRAAWETLRGPLFAWTPRQLWVWRRLVLRIFGARVGRRVNIHPTARIEIPWNLEINDFAAIGDRAIIYNLGRITIGKGATVSQNAHLCAGSHDFRDAAMTLMKLPIFVDESAWICADAFVGPGVHVHAGAVVGARAVAMRDVASNTIVAGNPAKVVSVR